MTDDDLALAQLEAAEARNAMFASWSEGLAKINAALAAVRSSWEAVVQSLPADREPGDGGSRV